MATEQESIDDRVVSETVKIAGRLLKLGYWMLALLTTTVIGGAVWVTRVDITLDSILLRLLRIESAIDGGMLPLSRERFSAIDGRITHIERRVANLERKHER